MVWQGSQQVNCGYTTFVKDAFNSYYVVCQYYPAGNYVGEYAANVASLNGGHHITATLSLVIGAVFYLVA